MKGLKTDKLAHAKTIYRSLAFRHGKYNNTNTDNTFNEKL